MTAVDSPSFRWVYPPGELPGWIVFVAEDGRETTYRISAFPGDTYELRKEVVNADGSTHYPAAYVVTLGECPRCTCPAWQWSKAQPRSCKHCTTLALALDAIANGAAA